MPFMRLSSDAQPSALIVHLDPDVCLSLTHRLTAKGYEVESVPDGKTCLERMRHQGVDAMLLSEHLSDHHGLSLLNPIRVMDPTLPVIFVTGAGPSPMALQRGAFAVIALPCEREEPYSLLQKGIKGFPMMEKP
jgi:DNA-binding NtrC family response regulator